MGIFLETERLALRPFTDADSDADSDTDSDVDSDVELLLALHNDAEVMRFINGGRAVSRETVRQRTLPRLRHRHPCFELPGYWAAELRTTGTFLGWFEFRPLEDHSPAVVELGYRLHRAAWGSGYATEGARALIAKGFDDLGVERVTANTMAVNTASRRVMERAGLSYVRHFTGDWPEQIEGSEHGEVLYELTRADWRRG